MGTSLSVATAATTAAGADFGAAGCAAALACSREAYQPRHASPAKTRQSIHLIDRPRMTSSSTAALGCNAACQVRNGMQAPTLHDCAKSNKSNISAYQGSIVPSNAPGQEGACLHSAMQQ